MQGFRMHSKARFATLFASVFPHISGLTWVTLTQPFVFPFEWLDASGYDEATNRYCSGVMAEFEKVVRHVGTQFKCSSVSYGYVAQADIFPRYASIVSHDWCSFFGLPASTPDPESWLKAFYDAPVRSEYLRQAQCEVVFLNIDAAFWEIYARPVLLRMYEQHLLTSKIKYDACCLENAYL
jgi:hypothetical protein